MLGFDQGMPSLDSMAACMRDEACCVACCALLRAAWVTVGRLAFPSSVFNSNEQRNNATMHGLFIITCTNCMLYMYR